MRLLTLFSISALSIVSCGLVSCGYDSPEQGSAVTASSATLRAATASVLTPEVVELAPSTKAARISKVALKVAQNTSGINLCEGLPIDTKRVAVKPVAKPPYLKAYKDPAFGTHVTRITDSKFGEVRKPAYSTMQVWNADESLMILFQRTASGGKHVLLDGQTYEPIRELKMIPSDLEEVHWSHSDPNEFFFVSKASGDYGLFKRYDIKKNKSSVIKDFSKQCGSRGLPTGGGDIQMQSLDDDLFGFRCAVADKKGVMLSYRISTDETVVQAIGKDTEWDPWTAPSPAPSGKRFWYQGTVLGLDLETVEARLDMVKYHEHANVGRTHDGQDAIYTTVFNASPNGCNEDIWQGIGHLVEHNLETGECRPIINEAKGYPYTTSGTHVSAQAYQLPGWVAMSSIGYDQFKWFSNDRKAPALFSEIYLANTDPENEVVCRLAQHRSFGKHAKQGGYPPYFGEPHATMSPSGTRIIFGSDWYDSGSVDSYVIELPSFVRK